MYGLCEVEDLVSWIVVFGYDNWVNGVMGF